MLSEQLDVIDARTTILWETDALQNSWVFLLYMMIGSHKSTKHMNTKTK